MPGFKEPTYRKDDPGTEVLVYFRGGANNSKDLEVRIYKLKTMFISSTDLELEEPESVMLFKDIPDFYWYEFDPNEEREAPFQRDFFQRAAVLFVHSNWISQLAFKQMNSGLEAQVRNFLVAAIVP